MNVTDMLKRWLEFSKYDPEEKKMVISADPLVDTYSLHKLNQNIAKILDGYDPSGNLALIYAKNQFMWMIQNSKMALYKILSDPNNVKPYQDMYNMFTCREFQAMESEYLDALSTMLECMLGIQMIGDRDVQKETQDLHDAVDSVLDSLTKCKLDIYKCGGSMMPIQRFANNIYCFDLLSECLLTLEHQPDGLYLCYISANHTMDGYFGIFIKSNGNLISIHDRIDESFPGEHSRHRNNRYIEDKKYQLFPYKELIEYSGSDYKGYATRSEVKSKQYPIKSLDTRRVFGLVLVMHMLSQKYTNAVFTSDEQMYVDSLLPANVEKNTHELPETCTELVVQGKSEIADMHAGYKVDFTTNDILTGAVATKFSYDNKENMWGESGGFYVGANQLMVDLWADGFTLDTTYLHDPNKFVQALDEASGEVARPIEFVGRKRRLDMVAYMNARHQLAQYMRDRIYEEFIRVGGPTFASDWWDQKLKDHRSRLQDIAVRLVAEAAPQHNEMCRYKVVYNQEYFSSWETGISVSESQRLAISLGKHTWKWRCPITGNMANTWIIIECCDWKELEALLGEEVPKILKGWKRDGHDCKTNTILHAHDPVEQVGTPYERHQQDPRYYRNRDVFAAFRESICETEFTLAFGFSKRGLNQLIKQYKDSCKK